MPYILKMLFLQTDEMEGYAKRSYLGGSLTIFHMSYVFSRVMATDTTHAT